MSKQDNQGVVAPSAVVAAGLASATAAVVTSKFGVAGTVGGAAMTAMIINGGSAIYRAYIERASSRIKDIPSSVQIRTGSGGTPEADSPPGRPDLRNNLPGRFRAALGWFPTLPLPRRRSILIGALIAGVISLLLGMGTVTGAELGVGKSLSCWVWNNCPAKTSADGGTAANVSTMPSIFGGGQSSSGGAPQAQPPSPRQQPVPGAPGSPSQTPNAAAPPGSPSQAPNAVPGSEQPAPSTPDQQSNPSGGSPGNPSGAPKDQPQENQPQAQPQPSPSGDYSKDQQRGNQGSAPPAGSGKTAADEPQASTSPH